MDRKISSGTAAIVGMIIMAATLILFFLMTDADARIALDWWGLGFMLGAEMIATLGIIAVGTAGQNHYRSALVAGAYPALTIYGITAVLIAAVFVFLTRGSHKLLIGIETVLLALVAVIIVVLLNQAKRMAASNSAVMYAATAMAGLVSRAGLLRSGNRATPFAPALDKLYEALKYSDHSAMTGTDSQIHQQLYDLESMVTSGIPAAEIERQIDALLASVRMRGEELRQAKLGGI